MRVIEVFEKFGIDSLKFAERPEPEPGPGQVVLKVRAVSLNYRDLLVVNGVNRWRSAAARIPGSDAVGVVDAVGSGVTRLKKGDRVAPIFYPRWLEGKIAAEKLVFSLGSAGTDGVLAESIAVDEDSVVLIPPHLSDEEGATLPCAGVTAWNAVVCEGRLKAGDTVVVLGTGGVSLFSLQLANMLGARVIVTSSSDQKLARAAELGAWAGVNYRSSDWPQAVLKMTGGAGADHVVDTVGDLDQAVAAVRVGGTVAFVGVLTGLETRVNLVALMGKSARIQAIDVGSREMFEAMNRAIAHHSLRPVVDRVFPFADAAQALHHLAGATHFGKICIRVG